MREATSGTLSAGRGVLMGTLIVGVLDALDAVVVLGLRSGVTPARIFRGIAAAVFGPTARAGGAGMAAIGIVLHFTVALGIVATYVAATRLVPALNRTPWLFGPLYGVVAFLVMNVVVIPLSAIGAPPRFDAFGLANGLLIHMIGVGLPTALVAARIRPPRGGV